MAPKSLVVLGGTGFLGKHICVAALNAGWKVTSLSRSGKLSKDQLDGFPLQTISQIQWKKADVFNPASYEAELAAADGVVHSLGVIFPDARYKTIIGSNMYTEMPKILSAVRDIAVARTPLAFLTAPFSRAANPMAKRPADAATGDAAEGGFEKLNKESAVLLAQEFARAKAARDEERTKDHALVYISAEDYNRFAPEEYIESKRAAESLISEVPGIRGVFLRPGFMTDHASSGGTLRDALGNAFMLRNNLAKVFGVEECVGASPVLSAQTVAKAVVEALDDATLSGPISLGALHKYATEFAK